MEPWRTSTTVVASSHDLLHPQPPPDLFSCVSLHPGNLSWAHILFFPIGVANGKAIWLQFLFYLCLWGKRKQTNVKTMGLPCLEQCCALDNHRIIMIPFLASAPTAHSHFCGCVSLHSGNLVLGPHQIDFKKYIIPLNQLGFFQKEREKSCKFMCYQSPILENGENLI
jgi:hypothetical protein